MRAVHSLAEANDLLQFIVDRLNQIIGNANIIQQATFAQEANQQVGAPTLAQARIDAALVNIASLTMERFQKCDLLRGAAEIASTLNSLSFVQGSQIFRANLEATGDLQVQVQVHEPAAQAELILLASAFEGSSSNDPAALILDEKIVVELNSHLASELFTFNAGTSAMQILATMNLFSDITGIEAAFLHGAIVLHTQDYGSQAFVELQVLDEGETDRISSNLSTHRAHGQDVEACINGVPAYGAGNRITLSTEQLALELSIQQQYQGTFEFRIVSGGIRFELGQANLRLGLNSLSPTQLGTSEGRLFELGSGQAKCLAEDPAAARLIAREVKQSLSNLRDRMLDVRDSLNEDAAEVITPSDTVGPPKPFGQRRLPKAPRQRSAVSSQIVVHAGPSIRDVQELSENDLDIFLRR